MQEIKEFTDYVALLEAAKSAGIKSQKLDEAVESYSLPTDKPFTFAKVELVEDGSMSHIRLITDTDEKISVGKLLASPSLAETKTDIKAIQQTANADKESYKKWFMSGNRINPALPSNQAKCATNLLGKTYRAELVEGFTLPFESKDGKAIFCATEKQVQDKAIRKGFYRLVPVEE